MAQKTLDELIDGDLPPAIAALPPDRLAELAETVERAEHKEFYDLQAAANSLLDLVPKMLRGAVKKAVRM
ncbi:hypothetical protein [Nocardia amikacinitolerans]|uniref:hypothetical protein n=1 Tax=Nocardia amikacinitolerans TaxID=756689 RepID=UPI0020A3354A|nr:hypothetical protein [Nocardia amikacinitolerans]MCP2288613.1 hypothetical protein [Nocardia amikacinitolerans]